MESVFPWKNELEFYFKLFVLTLCIWRFVYHYYRYSGTSVYGHSHKCFPAIKKNSMLALVLKLKIWQYPAINTNYSVSNCTIFFSIELSHKLAQYDDTRFGDCFDCDGHRYRSSRRRTIFSPTFTLSCTPEMRGQRSRTTANTKT